MRQIEPATNYSRMEEHVVVVPNSVHDESGKAKRKAAVIAVTTIAVIAALVGTSIGFYYVGKASAGPSPPPTQAVVDEVEASPLRPLPSPPSAPPSDEVQTSPLRPLPSPPSPPALINATAAYVANVVIPDSVLSCSDSKWNYDENKDWTFEQIAEAFYEYGIKPWNFEDTNPASHVDDCVSALTIVSGECVPTADPKKGCRAAATGPSGVFQTDFLRTVEGFTSSMPDKSIMNLCSTAFGAGYMIAPFEAAANRASTISVGDGAPAAMYTCLDAYPTVNEYGCNDPQAKAGETYSNFIGPFCHKSMSGRWGDCAESTSDTGSCCAQWNGGGNSYQIPFPDYYYSKEAAAGGSEYFTSICKAAAGI